MASAGGIWAIDIGSNALKALHLAATGEGMEVVGFDYIEHGRILSAGGIDDEVRQRVISESLHTFASRNDVGKDEVAITVAGQNSFVRFVKLPPVDKKRIPEIVQFEAVQQIPFDINEVEWDWQIMENPDSPDTEVGIFAIKNEIINTAMDHFARENMNVSCVQISPVALYNYALCDINDVGGFNEKATVLVDMGAENTTLVVCSKAGMWQRSIRIGGNTFTEAIADTFNLSFQKAEKLKRTAPVSKYMRQIFTAMKPVFTDLGSEMQRSLGFYSSSGAGREKGFAKIVAFGGGMKLQGLAKYLQQTLNVPVVKPDRFERLPLNAAVSAAKFHENVSDFGVAYGLGAQMLAEAKIKVNLLPRKLARAMAWRRKGRMFTAAAGLLLVVSLLGLVRANIDRVQYKRNESVRTGIRSTISQAQVAQSQRQEQDARKQPLMDQFNKEMDRLKYRDVVPSLIQAIMSCLPNGLNNPDQAALYESFEKGDVAGVLAVPRGDRKQLFVTGLTVAYAQDLSKASMDIGRQQVQRTMWPTYSGIGESTPQASAAPAATHEEGAGFVVVVEGYSPYKDIPVLLDPHTAEGDQSKWGFVTRLANIGKLVRGCEFELYDKGDIRHFSLESGPVDVSNASMPRGIGLQKEVQRVRQEADATRRAATYDNDPTVMGRQDRIFVERVLVDPMTNEEMSRVFNIITAADVARNPNLTEKDIGRVQFDKLTNAPQYIERDYWFKLSAKFRWKNAPKLPEPPTASDEMMQGQY